MPLWQGWLPWIVVSVVVIAWTHLKVSAIGQQAIPWPGLHNQIAITLYDNKPYAAVWAFQPLATGTAVLVASAISWLAFWGWRYGGCIHAQGAIFFCPNASGEALVICECWALPFRCSVSPGISGGA